VLYFHLLRQWVLTVEKFSVPSSKIGHVLTVKVTENVNFSELEIIAQAKDYANDTNSCYLLESNFYVMVASAVLLEESLCQCIS